MSGCVSETPGYPHYVEGLPLWTVRSLSYVDRDIRGRGIFTLLDDFVGGYPAVILTGSSDTNFGPYHASSFSTLTNATAQINPSHYESGAQYLQEGSGGTATAGDAIAILSGESAFRYEIGRRLWFTVHVTHDAWGAQGNVAIGLVRGVPSGAGLDPSLWPNDVNFAVPGFFFLKLEGESDWSFYIVEYSGGSPTHLKVANVVTTGTGQAPVSGAYDLLSFQVERDGSVLVYAEGFGVVTIPASDSHLVGLLASESDPPPNAPMQFIADVSLGASVTAGVLGIDDLLVAEETSETTTTTTTTTNTTTTT